MINKNYIIHQEETLLNALKMINSIGGGPLVLFAIDDEDRLVGTLTDGDSRRALIADIALSDSISKVINRNFKSLIDGVDYDVLHLRELKRKGMRLVPILDKQHHIVDIIDLEKYITVLPIDAVLMAGGKGERLRPLTEITPKPLLPVGGKPIIDYNVDSLIKYGVKNISVTVNYLKEQIESHFSKRRDNVQIHMIREPKYLGTMGSIRFVPEFYHDTILVMNSDVFTNLNFEEFYIHFFDNNADMSVCTIPYSVQIPYGVCQIENDDIKSLSEKPTFDYYVNAGIYMIKRDILDYVPDDMMFHGTDLIDALLRDGKKVTRFPFNGVWIDIGNPQEYKRANELVKYMR